MKKNKKKKFLMTRRQILKAGMIGGAGLILPWKIKLQKAYAEFIAGGTLDPTTVSKYGMPLVKPPAMPGNFRKNKRKFDIAVKQFEQQILPSGMPKTTVWSYGPARLEPTLANSYFYPAFTVENQYNIPTQVKWVNGLKDGNNDFLPHLLPVDPSLHWANTIGRRDTRPNPTDDPDYWSRPYIDVATGNYTGPVPMVVHVHGAHVVEQYDGYTEAWYLPNARMLPGINKFGTFFEYFRTKYGLNKDWGAGSAQYYYSNDQPATTLWYHDHTLGMTRLNVYAGPAGFWLIRGGPGDLDLGYVAPGVGDDPFGEYTEIPIAIQDRSFNDDGSLFYPDNRAFFEGLDPAELQIPFTYDQLGNNPDANGWGLGCDGSVSDIAPIWNPEFFGNMMVVNGQTWPKLQVQQRRYRFRLLNGCNSRFLILKTDNNMPFYQIGSDQGFLPDTVELDELLMGPAERADVIMDFTEIPVGTQIIMLNLGPDEPFNGEPGWVPADPATTGQVMKFIVKARDGDDNTTPPLELTLPQPETITPTENVNLSLNEEESKNIFVTGEDPVVYNCSGEAFAPAAALLGTLVGGYGVPKMWAAPVTENPVVGATQQWTFYNLTADAHPMHVHLVHFQVVNRQALVTDADGVVLPALVTGPTRDPEPWELGNKDTVIAYPGEVTRIKMHFDLPGFYVWHCHIVEHEDNEMMRPFVVGTQDPDAPHPHT